MTRGLGSSLQGHELSEDRKLKSERVSSGKNVRCQIIDSGVSGPARRVRRRAPPAPGGALRIVGRDVQDGFVGVFYDVNLSGPPNVSDLEHDLKNNPRALPAGGFTRRSRRLSRVQSCVRPPCFCQALKPAPSNLIRFQVLGHYQWERFSK